MKAQTLLDAYYSADGPGVALGLINRGKQSEIYCKGLADIAAKISITPTTRFELASTSKVITATVILKLLEQGRIDLQHEVGPLIGVFNVNKNARPITVRDLLQHTSDLPDYLANGGFTPAEKMKHAYVMEQLPEWFDCAVPGQSFEYSNTNYVILARIVEFITGNTYTHHLRMLFDSLNMKNTDSVAYPETQLSGLAHGYHNANYGLQRFEKSPNSAIDTEGDGGVFSTVSDLMIWQQAFWNQKILRNETIELMTQPGQTDTGDSFPYGLGIQVETTPTGGHWFGHGGSWVNGTSLVGHYPDADISVIILSNEVMAPVERISQRLVKLLCNT